MGIFINVHVQLFNTHYLSVAIDVDQAIESKSQTGMYVCSCIVLNIYVASFLNQACTGRRLACAWFIGIGLSTNVCVPAPEAINN